MSRVPREIKEVLDESEERGLIDEDQGDMIEGIFDLKQTVAREIMIPRTHIVSLAADSDRETVLRAIIDSGHSRIPVYRDNIDQIVGMVYAKDLLPLCLENETEWDVTEIAREAYFVPETKPIKDLLDELRIMKSHLAVIVDEYGGTSGIVTIEDIIEEIIGEIRDEHDIEEEPFVRQDDNSVIVNARVPLDDFEKRFEISLPRGGYDTLGGFIIHLMGRVPRSGEELLYGDLKLRIHGGDQKRVSRVRVEAPTPPESDIPEVDSDS
jgi:magnesium and cobalt transporter